jgi:hypothetical protein
LADFGVEGGKADFRESWGRKSRLFPSIKAREGFTSVKKESNSGPWALDRRSACSKVSAQQGLGDDGEPHPAIQETNESASDNQLPSSLKLKKKNPPLVSWLPKKDRQRFR